MKLRIQRTWREELAGSPSVVYGEKNPTKTVAKDELQYWDDETGWNPVEIFEVDAKVI